MKITAIKTSTLNVPSPPPRNTYYPHNTYVVARIQTDEGIEGLGYTMLVGGNGASSVRAYLEDNIVPTLIGEDPLQIGKLWHKMYDADRGIRKKGIPMYAISAVDIALWDVLGKSVGRPLWQLWGGVTDRVPVYGGGGFLSYTIDDHREGGRGDVRDRREALQDESRLRAASRHDGEREARGRGAQGDRRRAEDPRRREPAARRAHQRAARERDRAVRHLLVRRAGLRGQYRPMRRGRAPHQHPGRDRRERVHALRLQGSRRAESGGDTQPGHHARAAASASS